MKVYDTDEKAVAAYARKQTLAKALMVIMMLLFSGFGIWTLMRWMEPSAQVQPLPTTIAYEASPAAGRVLAILPVGAVALPQQGLLLAAV